MFFSHSTRHPYHSLITRDNANRETQSGDNGYDDAYHESVAVLDQDVPGAAVSLEEALQITFPHAVGQTADVYS